MRLAIGTTGWYGDEAATQSWGMATALLPCFGHANAAPLRIVVVVVVEGTIVEVVVEDGVVVVVVVVEGGIVVVVEVELVVDVGSVVVVVGVGPVAQRGLMPGAIAIAAVVTSGETATRVLTTTVTRSPRRNHRPGRDSTYETYRPK